MTEQPQQPPEHLPDPNSDPVEPEPTPDIKQSVQVPCAGCGRTYSFEIDPKTATFTFMCKACNTRTEWVRTEG